MSRQHDSRYQVPADPYAHARCACGHLLYVGMEPGGPCVFAGEGCGCTDHRPKEVAGDAADEA